MIFVCNRFAILPRMCFECKRYVWLEGYRRADVYKSFLSTPSTNGYIKENICKDCLTKFDVITDQLNEEKENKK